MIDPPFKMVSTGLFISGKFTYLPCVALTSADVNAGHHQTDKIHLQLSRKMKRIKRP